MSSFRHQYWTPVRILVHHTVGGCNLQPGDLMGCVPLQLEGPGRARIGFGECRGTVLPAQVNRPG